MIINKNLELVRADQKINFFRKANIFGTVLLVFYFFLILAK